MRLNLRTCLLTVVAAAMTLTPAIAQAQTAAGNDEITGAVQLPSLPATITQDPAGATRSLSDPPSCWTGFTVWFTMTAPKSGTVRFAPRIGQEGLGHIRWEAASVYKGSPGALTMVGCDVHNEDREYVGAIVDVPVTTGDRLYIMVGEAGNSGESGSFCGGDNTDLPCWPASLSMTASYLRPAPVVSVTTNISGSVNRAGLATVRGTLKCSYSTTATVVVTLSQTTGRKTAIATNGNSFPCTTTQSAWSLSFTSTNGIRFGTGTARVRGQVVATGDTSNTTVPIDAKVTLKR